MDRSGKLTNRLLPGAFSAKNANSTAFLTAAIPGAGRRPVSIRSQINPRIETEEHHEQ
jgi:hypothetical protein